MENKEKIEERTSVGLLKREKVRLGGKGEREMRRRRRLFI
jgi:hypothetical protein